VDSRLRRSDSPQAPMATNRWGPCLMSHSTNYAPLVVEGDIIRYPLWRSWLGIGFGIFFGLQGIGTIVFGLFVVLGNRAPSPSPGFIVFLFGGGLVVIIFALAITLMCLWQIKDRPRWVIGPDQLQFVQGVSRVRLSIPYSNLAAVELCKPGWGIEPFIGLRLVYPELVKFYAGGAPLISHRIHQGFGYHWRITTAESDHSLSTVREMIQRRLAKWRAGASVLPTASLVLNPVTDVTASPNPLQQNFIPNDHDRTSPSNGL
jgi:hypothetical protein